MERNSVFDNGKVSKILGVDVDQVEAFTEDMYQRAYMFFMHFVENCEAKYNNIVPSSGANLLINLWRGNTDGVGQVHHSLNQLHQKITNWGNMENRIRKETKPVENSQFGITADETCHVQFSRQFESEKVVGDDNAPIRTLGIQVFMDMRWDIERGKPYNIKNYSARVKLVESVNGIALGSLTNYKRNGVYRYPREFIITPDNAAFMLAVHMMFAKSQLCYILKHSLSTSHDKEEFTTRTNELIELWHRQWFRGSIWEISSIYGQRESNVITNKYLTADDNLVLKLNTRVFYRRLMEMLYDLMTKPIPEEIQDSMGDVNIRCVNDTPKFVSAQYFADVSANYFSDNGGGIYPTISINTDPKHTNRLQVTVREDSYFGKNIEICQNEDMINGTDYSKSFTVILDNLHTPDADMEKCISNITRIVNAYLGILYIQSSDAFGIDVANDFLTFENDMLNFAQNTFVVKNIKNLIKTQVYEEGNESSDSE